MAQRAGRITCPRCGANNFDTVTSCWKCGAPVGAAAPLAAAPLPGPAPQGPGATGQPVYAPQVPMERAAPLAYGPSGPGVGYAPQAVGDTGVARRAALLLGLTIPFIGLPVGWIFMMIEDRSKQAVGRWCVTWSVVGLVLHLFVTYFMVQQSLAYLRLLLPVIQSAARRGNGDTAP